MEFLSVFIVIEIQFCVQLKTFAERPRRNCHKLIGGAAPMHLLTNSFHHKQKLSIKKQFYATPATSSLQKLTFC